MYPKLMISNISLCSKFISMVFCYVDLITMFKMIFMFAVFKINDSARGTIESNVEQILCLQYYTVKNKVCISH